MEKVVKPMKNSETAKRLSTAMNLAGITQQELSSRSGVNKSSISQYVNGSHVPSNVSAGKMAKVLGVSPVWLMGFDVPMREEDKTYNDDPEIVEWVQHAFEDPDMRFLFEMKKNMTPERFKRFMELMRDSYELESKKNAEY